jgi:undecaprenyl phosphate-alpha-L-ara4N flippase subunit ArnE
MIRAHIATALLIVASMACTVIGNLLLKLGSGEAGVMRFWPLNLLNAKTLLGGVVFSLAMIFYIMVLKRTSLNLAQSIFATQFVLVIFAAHFVLGEMIGPYRWLGIGFIAAGLFIIALAPAHGAS